jgi:hypothetical protein
LPITIATVEFFRVDFNDLWPRLPVIEVETIYTILIGKILYFIEEDVPAALFAIVEECGVFKVYGSSI